MQAACFGFQRYGKFSPEIIAGIEKVTGRSITMT